MLRHSVTMIILCNKPRILNASLYTTTTISNTTTTTTTTTMTTATITWTAYRSSSYLYNNMATDNRYSYNITHDGTWTPTMNRLLTDDVNSYYIIYLFEQFSPTPRRCTTTCITSAPTIWYHNNILIIIIICFPARTYIAMPVVDAIF